MSNLTGPSPRRRRLGRLVLVGLAIVLLYTTRGWTLPLVGRFLDVSEPPAPVDYVMVLGGGAETRPFVAAALVKKGLVRKVLLPTVRRSLDAEDGIIPDETTIYRLVLQARGLPDEVVVILPGEVTSTVDEAQALLRFLEAEGEVSVAILTNDYHTRRARRVFARALGARMARIHFVAAPTDGFDANDWWRTEAGFDCYSLEYLKLVHHLVND